MSMKGVIAFFKPSRPVLIAFSLLMILALVTQYNWNVTPEERRIYAYFPGLVWMILTLPLIVVSWVTTQWFLDTPLVDIYTPLGAVSCAIYYYLLACFIAFCIRSIRGDELPLSRTSQTSS
jgi:hypothetical protein